MAARSFTLTEAFAGPQITVYGNVLLDFPLNDKQAATAGISSTNGSPRFARILAFQIDGKSCTRLPRPILLTVFGDGEELTHPECGFSPGQVRKWPLSMGTQVMALDPSQGAIEEILTANSSHGHCACEGGSTATAVKSKVLATDTCISLTISNGQACLNIPVIGNVCIPVPSWIPNGTLAQACFSLCTVLGIPCGASVTVSVAGTVVASESFGCC